MVLGRTEENVLIYAHVHDPMCKYNRSTDGIDLNKIDYFAGTIRHLLWTRLKLINDTLLLTRA